MVGDQGSLQFVLRFDTRIGDGQMIDHGLLKKVVTRSAKVAALFLGIDITYSVRIINDSSLIQDGRDPTVVRKTQSFNLPTHILRSGPHKGKYKIPAGSTIFTCFSSDFWACSQLPLLALAGRALSFS